MTREQAKELLPVMQAFAEGKELQVTYDGCNHGWEDYGGNCPNFENHNLKWRVKPEPREGWIPAYAVCASQDDAAVLARSMIGSHLSQTSEIIHVREVLE